MKIMRGRIMRKLKFVSTKTTLKDALAFQVNVPDQQLQETAALEEYDRGNLPELVQEVDIGVLEPIIDAEEEISPHYNNAKERPPGFIDPEAVLHAEGEEATGRVTLHNNQEDLLAAEMQACKLHIGSADADPDFQLQIESSSSPQEVMSCLNETGTENGSSSRVKEEFKEFRSLSEFEEKCPPGGKESVILYTTSLRGIRKTFEDCNTIRFLLESFRVVYQERDVSMHLEYREELWRTLKGKVIPPRLFIRGRYIGGADEVVVLHEQGMLLRLLRGIPKSQASCPCNGCAGVRFLVCGGCNGSRKVTAEGQDHNTQIRCSECNENGLVVCPICI